MNLRKLSTMELDAMMAFRTKNNETYPETFLAAVEREIKRRDTKRAKRGGK